uniref:Uncharacterized protein n=1 Tax=Heterorhabditis bacteriophora TaxID=37862 RepID=A0A1I7XMY7_HETBA
MQRYTSKVFGHKTNITSDHNNVIAHFSSASISVRAQKTIASKLSTRSKIFYYRIKFLINLSTSILGCKNMIKIAVKLAVLSHNDLLEEQEAEQLVQLQKQLHSLALTTISFSQVC